ncbi:conserved Plasmodium protein, unknown function, partial [Plasmodium malariae]
DVKNSRVRNYVLNENTNSLFCFNAIKEKYSREFHTVKRDKKRNNGIITNFKILENLLFYDLYYNIVARKDKRYNEHLSTTYRENYKQETVIQNLLDLKSENNAKGVKRLLIIAPDLCTYTTCKIVIPLALNYVLQTSSKKETYNKFLSLNSIKLLGLCLEKVGIKIVYNLLHMLLSELKKNSFNKLYIEKSISHIARKYDFKEFQEMKFKPYLHFSKNVMNQKEKRNEAESDTVKSDNEGQNKREDIKAQYLSSNECEEERAIRPNEVSSIKEINSGVENVTYIKKKYNLHCNKFIQYILPQLKFLMFDRTLMNNKKKKKKSYINDLVVDHKNKDVVAKPDIIISFLVILNKMNYNFQKELHKIIYKLCYCLSSKTNNIRNESKKTLCYISMYLGLNYFDLIIKQMSDYLVKGYHISIFLCTVNSILEYALYEKDKFLDKNYLKINFNTLNEGNMKKKKKKCQEDIELEELFSYKNICTNIFNMIKLEIINEIDKNTEDVNKTRIKRKTMESKKTYGSNIIKLLTTIMPEKCIENNILTFLESLFSGESFENNEVEKNFIFKKKYINIISCYFNNFIKGIEENK